MQAQMKSELETRLQKLELRLMGQMKTAAAVGETGTYDFIELIVLICITTIPTGNFGEVSVCWQRFLVIAACNRKCRKLSAHSALPNPDLILWSQLSAVVLHTHNFTVAA